MKGEDLYQDFLSGQSLERQVAKAVAKAETPTIKLALVDEQPVVRRGIVASLARHPRFSIVSESSSVEDLIRAVRANPPDVVLLGVHAVIEATGKLRERLPGVQIIVFASRSSDEAVRQAVSSGVRGYLLTTSELDEVIDAIDAVHAGEAYFTPSISRVFAVDRNARTGGARLSTLTKREREVLVLVAAGRTSRDIADLLGLSFRTVDTYRERIMQKLDIRSIAGLTRFAIENELVDPSVHG